jgi:predicted ATPase
LECHQFGRIFASILSVEFSPPSFDPGAADRNAFYAPEIYRLEGELMLLSDPGSAGAEESLQSALDLARRRAVKSLELRAATSLARLWGGQRRKEEAWRLLADIYGWFTEGLQTRDLIAAKALLEELKA